MSLSSMFPSLSLEEALRRRGAGVCCWPDLTSVAGEKREPQGQWVVVTHTAGGGRNLNTDCSPTRGSKSTVSPHQPVRLPGGVRTRPGRAFPALTSAR